MSVASRIYLTGFMASGKSTLGPLLARGLGSVFVDLDTSIEASAGRQIREIFETQGEAAFRALERKVLMATCNTEGVVIALGGGVLADEANLSFALRSGVVVYLCAREDTLAARLAKEEAVRPLLQDDSGHPMPLSSIRQVIRSLMQSRESHYRKAHIIFNVDHLSIEQAAQGLIDAILAHTESEGD